MNIQFDLLPGLALTVTWWKVVGWLGAFMFTSRWFVQLHASRKIGRPIIPLSYWFLSLFGSFLLLAYFVFGKNDSVGVITNLFPVFVAGYNLFLELTHRKRLETEAS